jgi:indole-3-glycerol phosphate synthase
MLVAAARERAAALRAREPELLAAAGCRPRPPSFAEALLGADVAVIAEVKRRSPSKGSINSELDAATQGRAYAAGGAAAISVLTEPAHFGGSNEDLATVQRVVGIPTLKKDFHVDPVQLVEARALGACAALLIARALSPDELTTMAAVARELELEVIVEIRDLSELERALGVDARMIGVNNRDLESLQIDPTTAARLVPLIPRTRIAIAESGMRSPADVVAAAGWGADAVLIGSSISAASDPTSAVRALTRIPRKGRDG